MFRTLSRVSIETPVTQVGAYSVPTLSGTPIAEVYPETMGDAYLAPNSTNSSCLIFDLHRAGGMVTASVLARRTLRELRRMTSVELERIAGVGDYDALSELAFRVHDTEDTSEVDSEVPVRLASEGDLEAMTMLFFSRLGADGSGRDVDEGDLGMRRDYPDLSEDTPFVRAYASLRRGCAAFSSRVQGDDELLRRFHGKTQFEKIVNEPWGLVFQAIADLAREGVGSDAYFLLMTLTSFENELAAQNLYYLIQSGDIENVDETNVSVVRARAMYEGEDSRGADRMAKFVGELVRNMLDMDDLTPSYYIDLMKWQPEELSLRVCEYVDEGRGDELSLIVQEMIRCEDSREDLNDGLSNLFDMAASDAGALYILRCFYREGYPEAEALIGDVDAFAFSVMFRRFKGDAILHGPPHALAEVVALQRLQVDPDETDTDYLRGLSRFSNSSANRRLQEIRESVDGEVEPLFKHE